MPWPSTMVISLARVMCDSTMCTRVGIDRCLLSQGQLVAVVTAALPVPVVAAGAFGVVSASSESVRDAVAAMASAVRRNRRRGRGLPGQMWLRGGRFIKTSVDVLVAGDGDGRPLLRKQSSGVQGAWVPGRDRGAVAAGRDRGTVAAGRGARTGVLARWLAGRAVVRWLAGRAVVRWLAGRAVLRWLAGPGRGAVAGGAGTWCGGSRAGTWCGGSRAGPWCGGWRARSWAQGREG